MNVPKVNLGLWTLTAALAAVAVVCAGLGVWAPVEVDSEPDGMARRAAATSPGSMGSQLSLAEFESIWRLNLRKSLTDAPATAPVADRSTTSPAAVAGAGGPFVLIGTIGDSLAMIRTVSGAVELKGLGEMVNGAKILAIRPAQVDVESDGQRMTVAKLREGSGG
jgi:hypothetical protein